MSDNPLLHFNGVNGDTGDYGVPPMSASDLAKFVQGESDPTFLRELKWRYDQRENRDHALKEGLDPKKLDEAGWGVVFTHDANPAIREALSSLLALRQSQAGERFRIYEKGDGYRVGKDSKDKFLSRHGAGPGAVDPQKVPYYLMLVGDPEKMPYRFQTQLDVQYGVGRIDFGDDLDAYANYADSVVAAETGLIHRPRKVSLFGVSTPGDKATELSSERLIAPLAEHLGKRADWTVDGGQPASAHKADLARLFGGRGADVPALFFSASHGLEFNHGSPRQLTHQGAILCQDWPGPGSEMSQDYYFAAEDLPSDANLLGLMAFFFACYGGGTPRYDDFSKQAFKDRAEIAPHAFTAALPKRMLSNPGGGALAAVGHVERAWGCSFIWKGSKSQTVTFESALDRLLDGHPIGSAFEYFNMRYAELSATLADALEEAEFVEPDPYELASQWTANNDARGYTVIGDPAVRLCVGPAGKEPKPAPFLGELRPLAHAAAPAAAKPAESAGKTWAVDVQVKGQAGTAASLAATVSLAEDGKSTVEIQRSGDGEATRLASALRALADTLEKTKT